MTRIGVHVAFPRKAPHGSDFYVVRIRGEAFIIHCMWRLIVLAQKVFAVIVALRCAHDDMDMVPVMFLELRKRLAGLVIEFDDEDRLRNPGGSNWEQAGNACAVGSSFS